MLIIIFILALTIFAVSATNFAHRSDELFSKFIKDHQRSYSSNEELNRRRAIFKESMIRCDKGNERNGSPVFGVTKFSDWTQEEFKRLLGRKKGKAGIKTKNVPVRTPGEVHKYRRGGHYSTAFDPVVNWKKAGYVTTVKNQGQCGSCWAFSVAETVESQWAINGNALWEFSPQQVASCTTNNCDGCGGGYTESGYEYLMTVVGLGSSWYAPYMQSMYNSCSSHFCTYSCSNYNMGDLQEYGAYTGPYATISGWQYATPACTSGACNNQNMTLLAANIQTYGPASICVDASNWNDYTGGIMTTAGCGGYAADDLDHCVQLVGYNAQSATPYWLVRNSWATNWGINGYIKLSYPANTCGLGNEATFVSISNNQTMFDITPTPPLLDDDDLPYTDDVTTDDVDDKYDDVLFITNSPAQVSKPSFQPNQTPTI